MVGLGLPAEADTLWQGRHGESVLASVPRGTLYPGWRPLWLFVWCRQSFFLQSGLHFISRSSFLVVCVCVLFFSLLVLGRACCIV